MNPNIQAQIFDVARGQFVQADGGELAMCAILFQILIEQRIQNYYLQQLVAGTATADDPVALRADALIDQTFVAFK